MIATEELINILDKKDSKKAMKKTAAQNDVVLYNVYINNLQKQQNGNALHNQRL